MFCRFHPKLFTTVLSRIQLEGPVYVGISFFVLQQLSIFFCVYYCFLLYLDVELNPGPEPTLQMILHEQQVIRAQLDNIETNQELKALLLKISSNGSPCRKHRLHHLQT